MKKANNNNNNTINKPADQSKSWSPADFYFGKLIGEGLFGKVYHARIKRQSFGSPSAPSSQRFNDDTNRNRNSHAMPFDHVAIKAIDKQHIIKRKKLQSIMKERKILTMLTHLKSPWATEFHMSFVDRHNVYMVMELGTAGTLYSLVKQKQQKQQQSLNIVSIQYYSGQILCALEHLHSNFIYHSDLKPENIVIMSNSCRVKLIDFDCAVDLSETYHNSKRSTGGGSSCEDMDMDTHVDVDVDVDMDLKIDFVGTADYAAPEVIKGSVSESYNNITTMAKNNNQRTSKHDLRLYYFAAIDLWSYGCLLYFMFVSQSPFHTESDYKTMQRILSFADRNSQDNSVTKKNGEEVEVEEEQGNRFEISWAIPITTISKDLILRLLVPNPLMRLGINSIVREQGKAEIENTRYDTIRQHEFFQEINWDLIQTGSSTCDKIILPEEMELEQDINKMTDGAKVCNTIEFFL